MIWRLRPIYILSVFAASQMACVGPTTPFGALNEVEEVQEKRTPASQGESTRYQIRFHPEKQVLHDKSDFSIEIKSKRAIPQGIRIQVTHNDLDVTEAFLENSYVHRSTDNKTLIYLMKNIRLKTLDPNDIRVRLIDDAGIVLNRRPFEAPDCSLFASRKLAHLGSFGAPKNYISMIERVATQGKANPSFLAGIVAQESGFNPQAVSWAKAIGLTQVTPLAEEQVMSHLEEWPRYPGINDLSYLTLKSKIYIGEIDQDKEWRLDPEKSLIGGLTYIQYLQKYWDLEQNKKLVDQLAGQRDENLTELILASYNSGAARVKRALQSEKDNWKNHHSLKEAVNYLRRVSSYCFHYTKKEEAENDNET